MRDAIAGELERARRRTASLLAPLDDEALCAQHSVLMSPLVWDLAHVGNYEDQWLVRALGAAGVGPQHDHVYDAFRHPRRNRPALPLLPPGPARAYIGEVRKRALDVLAGAVLDPDGPEPLLRDGFVYGMVVQHEHQHAETMVATLQLREAPYEGDVAGWGPTPMPGGESGKAGEGGEVFVAGGPFTMGTDSLGWAYDNERPAHEVDVAAFWVDAAPVTVADYRVFVEEGGYERPGLWSDDGWKWRLQAGLTAPEFWRADGTVRRFGRVLGLDDIGAEPVQHVCFYEAEAYARFVGKRLPTEAEWEKAAPLVQGVGQVWEWTASSFLPHPGFSPFPYREYSEVFFGEDYKVLRGGSWAADPVCARHTFRNWDYPIRRQIFSGFRCARDAEA